MIRQGDKVLIPNYHKKVIFTAAKIDKISVLFYAVIPESKTPMPVSIDLSILNKIGYEVIA